MVVGGCGVRLLVVVVDRERKGKKCYMEIGRERLELALNLFVGVCGVRRLFM